MKHVILFGGSFDPVHYGHLEIAKQAIKQLGADELWFVLAALSPFKTESASFSDRYKMLELMLEDSPSLKISQIENTLPSPSYSIDTVKALIKRNPNTKFSWLIGSDQIENLHLWKDFETLNTLVEFVVYDRPNYDTKHNYKTISGTQYNVSSTDIRHGLSLDTSPKVLQYMMQKGLYLKSLIENKLSTYRYEHTHRVCDVAIEIAVYHNLDLNKVRLSAMFHDFAKEENPESLKQIMQEHFKEKLNCPEAFYHGYVASYYLKNNYHILDKDVLEAIENHVGGTSTNPYAMCLYIADKCEPGRNFDSSEVIKLAKKNLNEGFKKIIEINNEYLRSKNEIN